METLSASKTRARLPEIAAILLLVAGCAGPDSPTQANPDANAAQHARGNPAGHAAAPPNIVIILADDLGYGDIGAYGAARINTPNIDRLAAGGLRFTHGYSSANVCSPSRAGLMTGRYAIRSGLAWKVVEADSTHGLPETEETLGELVKRQGYRTLYVGKWHLGNFPEHLPLKHGFDGFFGVPASNDMPNFALYDGDALVERPVDQRSLTRRYTDRAVRFIAENSGTPFMLFLAHTFPHIPLYASGEFRGKSAAGLYGDTVEELDWSTGQVLAALEDHGILDNTLVIFTSDNGPFFEGGTGGLRGGKGTSWDGGYRVPLIAGWPAVVSPGRVTGAMAMNIDVLPTIAEILGLEPAAGMVDGRSLLPVFRGADESPHDFLYYFNNERVVGVRSQDWKYVTHAYYLGSLGAFEEFDRLTGFSAPYEMLLDADGIDGEAYSYADRFPGILNEHKEALRRARRQFDALRTRDLEETYPRGAAAPGAAGMLLVPGGEFTMGADDGLPYEGPEHTVALDSFLLDRHEVTNAQYAAFADATGHVTESERLGWSGVFDSRRGGWTRGDGADWRHPAGPGSSHREMGDYPVVHVSWFDAAAYCEWRGARLPTEAEFEYAARGGARDVRYAWGNQLTPGGNHRANLWQGEFPIEDRGQDGFSGLAPVGTFPPNGFGFHDMTGNVWEWVQDWYAADYFARSPRKNPQGPAGGTQKVHRGGSWLCSENYCRGYRLEARMMTPPDSGLNNLGFRCAADPGS